MQRLLLALLFLLAFPASHDAQAGYPTRAPFEGVRCRGTTTECRVDGKWYELVELDGLPVDEILAFCAKTFGAGSAHKRFGEDLVEALTRMGHPPGDTVSLRLLDLHDEGDVTVLRPMTSANRQSVWRINNGRAPEDVSPPGVVAEERLLAYDSLGEPDPRYAFLADMVRTREEGDRSVAVDYVHLDLIELEERMRSSYSYLDLTGIDVGAAFHALHVGVERANPVVSMNALGLALLRFLALFGDGHTRAMSLRSLAPRGYADFLVGETDAGIVAFRSDRSGLIDPEHPYLIALDGLDLERWIEAAAPYSADGSPQARRRWALRDLRYLAQLRADLGREPRAGVVLTLRDALGSEVTRELPLEERRAPVYGSGPRGEDRVLPGNVGYLRLASMESDEAFLRRLRASMERFRETAGLVIDVRGNSGGSRAALRVLLPYFLAPDSGPRVVNVARYRIPPDQGTETPENGWLQNRFLYPLTWPGWSAREHATLAEFLTDFTPDREPGEGFSEWHAMLVGPEEAAFSYGQPVVVLCDTDCFSATDVFLGAFTELERVTLLGTPSAGGSGRTVSNRLRYTGVVVRLSSMASFRPNGASYDGKGVEVDELVRPIASDFTGETDAVLAAALERLRR